MFVCVWIMITTHALLSRDAGKYANEATGDKSTNNEERKRKILVKPTEGTSTDNEEEEEEHMRVKPTGDESTNNEEEKHV